MRCIAAMANGFVRDIEKASANSSKTHSVVTMLPE
jgi:hypothetical protein